MEREERLGVTWFMIQVKLLPPEHVLLLLSTYLINKQPMNPTHFERNTMWALIFVSEKEHFSVCVCVCVWY